MNSVKARKVKVGVLVILGPKRENLNNKNKKIKRDKTKENQKFLFQFGVHRNVLPLKFPVTLKVFPVKQRKILTCI